MEGLVPVMAMGRWPCCFFARLEGDLLAGRILPGDQNGDVDADDMEGRAAIARVNDKWFAAHDLF